MTRSPAPTDLTSPLRTPSGQSVPLLGVSIAGEVIGGHARITSTQRYRHDERQPVEAVYVFPLPSDAAVTGFVMEVAGRRLVAETKEREEAFRLYDDAVTSGHGAALVEQERANVFTANVGNLLPGEEVRIEITFVMPVPSDEGALRVMIPTLVAPRYMPGKPSGDRTGHGAADPTDRVPDADRISPRIGDVDYTLSLDLTVCFDASATIASPSHAITAVHDGSAWRVTLTGAALDRDLVLVVEPAEKASLERVVAHRDPARGDGYVALSWIPDLARLVPRGGAGATFSFVIDRSGSMGGDSIEEARRALRLCLRQLREGDRFEVIAFDDRVERFRDEPVAYTERTLADADRWIAGIDARGGTELREPMVMAARHGGVVVLLTDGQVGNEDEILEAVLAAAGDKGATRIYTFGIGTNVSDVLLGELAKRTGGAMELIHPGERIDEKVVATFAKAHAARVSRPVLEVGGVELDDLAPSRLPDLVDGEPWTVMARYARGGRTEVRLRGTLGGQPFVHVLVADLPDRADTALVPTLWARERIRDLEAQEVTGRRAAAMKDRILGIAIEHGLASRYTSFVVVEKRTGDRRVTEAAATRAVPVNAPAGWAMFEAEPEKARAERGRSGGMRKRAMAPMSKTAAVPLGGPPPAPAMPARAAAMAPAPMSPMAPGSRAIGAASGYAPPAPPPPPPHELDLLDAESDDMAIDAMAAPADLVSYSREEAQKESASPLDRTLEAQRASGLWDASHTTLAASIAALRVLVREGITTSHAIYGANAKKAVEAVVSLAGSTAIPASERETALLLAYLVASGRKSRALVLDAIRASAPALEARLADEAALRESLLA
ncbi:MAG: VIT domain-containing protein [Sandaracinus sp.]